MQAAATKREKEVADREREVAEQKLAREPSFLAFAKTEADVSHGRLMDGLKYFHENYVKDRDR